MRSKARFFLLSANLDSQAAAVAGFISIQLLAHYSGIGVSPDSVTYISNARHFLEGKGLIGFDARPLVDFPIFYPLFLALISFITRMDALVFGAVLNGLLFAFLLYTCGAIMNGFRIFSRWYKLVVLACLVISPCLLEIYSMLWSETLFIILIILFMVCFRTYGNGHRMKWLMASAVFAGVACITRYAGIVVIGTGAFLILLDKQLPFRKRIINGMLFGIASSGFLIMNILRNVLNSGMAAGARQKGITSLANNMQYFGNILGDWLCFNRSEYFAFFITLGVLLIFLISFIWFYRYSRTVCHYELIIACFGLIYCLFMLFSATVSRYERFTNRLLSPAFIPLLWCSSFWIPGFIRRYGGWMRWLLTAAVGWVAFVFIYIQGVDDYENYDGIRDAGIPGYTEDPFPKSDIVQYIQKNKSNFKAGYTIYSNAGDAVYFFTGLTAHILPQPVFPGEVQQYYLEGNNYLIWFNDIENPDLLDAKSIRLHKHMILLQQFGDGAVYVTADALHDK